MFESPELYNSAVYLDWHEQVVLQPARVKQSSIWIELFKK
jgi:hypothetical protein